MGWDLGSAPPSPSPLRPRKDTDSKDVDAVHGVFVVVGVDGTVAAEYHLPLQWHLCLQRDKWVTLPRASPPTPKSTLEQGAGPSPTHRGTHHSQAPDEHPLRRQQQDTGNSAGAQLGHRNEDDEEPRGHAH